VRITELLAYSERCRAVLRETLAAHPEAFDRPFPTESRFNTIRMLLAHMIAAEERWVQVRIPGAPAGVRYEERAAATVEGVFADWESIRAVTRAFIEAQDEAGLARGITVDIEGWSDVLSVEQILFHVFNHETHHRAQICLALMQQGIVPPDFDFIFLHG
jgi:uncharacterized damage-inducible protein DinB